MMRTVPRSGKQILGATSPLMRAVDQRNNVIDEFCRNSTENNDNVTPAPSPSPSPNTSIPVVLVQQSKTSSGIVGGAIVGLLSGVALISGFGFFFFGGRRLVALPLREINAKISKKRHQYRHIIVVRMYLMLRRSYP